MWKKLINNKWFTLVELIIWITLFSIFVLMWTTAFTNSLSNIQYIKTLWEEQESMLYDIFMIDELLSNSKEILEFNNTDNSTWYLFTLDRNKYNYSFATFDANYKTGATRNYYTIGIKKFIPLNDIILSWATDVIFSAPWENDIKKISNWLSVIWTGSWFLNNPTWLYTVWWQIYVSDTWNSCIRKVSDISNCFIWQSSMPWNDDKSLISPTFITGTGNIIYISDTYNNKIRKVNITSTWNIIDLFWNGNFWNDISKIFTGMSLSLPTWLALSGNILYVADTGNNRILKLDISTWSWSVFLWNGDDKTTFINSGSINPLLIPISHPTSVKIYNDRLYFSESTHWVMKSISLTEPYFIYNEVWTYKNLAYFWNFEDNLSSLGSYTFSNLTGGIVWQKDYIPYSWNNSLKIDTTSANTGSIIYNFSWITISPSQKINLSFYIKSLSWSYDLSYWLTNSNIFQWTYLTWIINENWKKYTIESSFIANTPVNWFSINIFSWSSFSWSSFLLDLMEINLDNIYMNGNISNKFENNFSYLSAIYPNGASSYFSNIISGENYNFNIWALAFSGQNYKFNGIKNKDNKYLFDDYVGTTKLIKVDYTEKQYISNNSKYIIWFRFLFNTLNWYFLDKYISISK